MTPSFKALPVLAAMLLAGGCATTRGAAPATEDGRALAPAPEVRMDPLVIRARPDPALGLDTYDPATLFDEARTAFTAKDYTRAALFFDRLIDEFPDSAHAVPSVYNAGLAHELSGDPQGALERYQYVLDEQPDAGTYLDALMRGAQMLMHLTRYDEAAALYRGVLGGGRELSATDRIEALTQTGVCHYHQGDLLLARDALERSLATFRTEEKNERIDNDFHVAQAQYYLAEIEHDRFRAAPVRLPRGDADVEAAGALLEAKCGFLLDAQREYIRTIRIGNPRWATAAGFRIGALYEGLYDAMIKVPVPPELDQDAAAVYVETLKKRVEVLVTKAIRIYERSLSMAERVGEHNDWVRKTAESLERLKNLYLAEYGS